MDTISDRIISAPIGEFCVLSGLGRTVVYEMITDGRLESIKIGKRRLILIDSYRKLVAEKRQAVGQRAKRICPTSDSGEATA